MFSYQTKDRYRSCQAARQGYDAAVPLPVKAGVGNSSAMSVTSGSASTTACRASSGDGASDLARLLINSTLGIFGLFDVGQRTGFEKHDEDFGQTLARWGVSDGGYLFWPVIGSRTYAIRRPLSMPMPTRLGHRRFRPCGTVPISWTFVISAGLPADKVVEEATLDKYSYIRDACSGAAIKSTTAIRRDNSN